MTSSAERPERAARGSRTCAVQLVLADGRFPAGGYAHSGGLEPAIACGSVRTVEDLERFIRGRLGTAGLVGATFAAAACRAWSEPSAGGSPATTLADLDAELDARTPSPALRDTSRQLGRQLVRALSAILPAADLGCLPTGPHHAVALGAAHGACGVGPAEAALAYLHEAAAGPVAAAVRLLSVDPFDTHAVLARMGPVIDDLVADAVQGSGDGTVLPAAAGPLLDTLAERHRGRPTRLFAS